MRDRPIIAVVGKGTTPNNQGAMLDGPRSPNKGQVNYTAGSPRPLPRVGGSGVRTMKGIHVRDGDHLEARLGSPGW